MIVPSKPLKKPYKIKQGVRSYKIGVEAEQQARLYFEQQGFSLLAQRYRTPLGEIDLLFANEEWLLAIEVKYRKNASDNYDALNIKQTSRLLNALDYILFHHPQWKRENTRFDLIIFNNTHKIDHIKDAIRLY